MSEIKTLTFETVDPAQAIALHGILVGLYSGQVKDIRVTPNPEDRLRVEEGILYLIDVVGVPNTLAHTLISRFSPDKTFTKGIKHTLKDSNTQETLSNLQAA